MCAPLLRLCDPAARPGTAFHGAARLRPVDGTGCSSLPAGIHSSRWLRLLVLCTGRKIKIVFELRNLHPQRNA